jgi:ribonuclease VapC
MKGEPDAEQILDVLTNSPVKRLSAASFVEASTVVDSFRDPAASREFDEILRKHRIIIEPVTESQARLAREAYRDFGKGSGHKAKLNFGDCFAYALALENGEPLLYKGNDFIHTGIASALKTH